MGTQKRFEIIGTRATELYSSIQAPRSHRTLQNIPKRDSIVSQLNEALLVGAVNSEKFMHDWPEGVLRVRIVLLPIN